MANSNARLKRIIYISFLLLISQVVKYVELFTASVTHQWNVLYFRVLVSEKKPI